MLVPRTPYDKPYHPTKQTTEFFVWMTSMFNERNKPAPAHFQMIDHINRRNKFKLVECSRGLAKLESGSSPILTPDGWTTMREIQPGDYVISRDGSATKVLWKTEPQYPQMYKMVLSDGTGMEVGEDHLHVVMRHTKGRIVEKVITTKEMYERGIIVGNSDKRDRSDKRTAKASYRFKLPLCEPVKFSYRELDIDPYVMGYGLGNGSFRKSKIHCHKDDVCEIIDEFKCRGYGHLKIRTTSTNGVEFKLDGHIFKKYELLKSRDKFVPKEYMYASIEQRVDLLRGLMDADGSISKNGSVFFSSYSIHLAEDVAELVRSLGGIATIKQYKDDFREHRVRIKIKSYNPFSLKRKAKKWKPAKIVGKSVVSLEKMDIKEEGYCIGVDHPSKTYLARNYTVTHNSTLVGIYQVLYWAWKGYKPGLGEISYILYIMETVGSVAANIEQMIMLIDETPELNRVLEIRKSRLGDDPTLYIYHREKKRNLYIKGRGAGQSLRGTRIGGSRPNVMIMDDIESEKTIATKDLRDKMKKWFFGQVVPAVDPVHEFIMIGTPLHEDSLLINALESEKWVAIQLPIAEKYPVEEEELQSAWPDRFTYEFINDSYQMYDEQGKKTLWYQEHMLEIAPSEGLVFDMDKINKFDVNVMAEKLASMTFYVSVDLAVSEKEYADFTSIAVIGIDSGSGDWFVVDGQHGRWKPDETIDRIFYFVNKYRPYSVLLEKVAFQLSMKTFVQNEMIARGIFFNLEMVGRTTQKISVIKALQPIVEMGKFWVPKDYAKGFVDELLHEMEMTTLESVRAKHDDILDSVAMLTLVPIVNANPVGNADFFEALEDSGPNPYVF